MRAFALMRMSGGEPDVDWDETPLHGYVLCDRIPGTNWGAYLVSGTGPQLLALDLLPQVLGILAFTGSDEQRWGPDMDNVIPAAVRNKINTWLENHNQPTVPAGWSYGGFLVAAYRRFNAHFDLDKFDVADVE